MSQRKIATIKLIVSADVNNNDMKAWVRTCPFSAEGDQTVHWENIPDEPGSDQPVIE